MCPSICPRRGEHVTAPASSSAKANPEQVWLILSHAFNMDGRAASQTVTDKIPHLVAQGVRPIVMSAMTGAKDEHVEHHQLPPVSPAGLRFDMRHVLKNRLRSKRAYRLMSGALTVLLVPFQVVEKLLLPLESQWSWFVSAYVAGARIIRRDRPTLIYSTGGANSAHIAGYLLHRRYRIPWLAEVHDPLVYDSPARRSLAERVAAWIEARICRHAAVAIWFTETALARARARHPELGERGRVMLPGADAPALNDAGYVRGEHCVIAHFGSLSRSRNLGIFLEGLAAVLTAEPRLRDTLRLHLYGSGVDPQSAQAIKQFPQPEVIRVFGRIERDTATGEAGRARVLRLMRGADCLLLLHGNDAACEEYIPSKLYEYLWMRRPILALVHRNPQMTQILTELGHTCVQADNAAAIAQAIRQFVVRWQRDELNDLPAGSPYTAKAAVEQLLTWVRSGAGGA